MGAFLGVETLCGGGNLGYFALGRNYGSLFRAQLDKKKNFDSNSNTVFDRLQNSLSRLSTRNISSTSLGLPRLQYQ